MGRAQAVPLEHVHVKILANTRAVLSGVAVAGVATAGIAFGAAPASAAPRSVWDRVAGCESGGNWHVNTGNGYYGGLQFSLATWRGYGGAGNPANASKSAQIAIAEKVLRGQGWGAWPVCSIKAVATGSSSSASTSSTPGSTSSTTSVSSLRSSDSPASYHASASSHTAHVSRAPARAPRHAAVTSDVSAAARAPRHAAVQLSGKTYTVRAGDTLSTVAKQLDVAGGWKQLWAANPTVGDPELIYVGQKLQIPTPSSSTSPSATSVAGKSSTGAVSSAAHTLTAAATSRAIAGPRAGTKSSAVTTAKMAAASRVGAGSSAASTHLPSNVSLAARAVAFARAHIGDPWVFAGAGAHSWDCSGLTMAAYASVGVDIGTHSATAQYNYAAAQGRLVSYASRQPGDLIFYTVGGGVMYHVAIYSGNGMMVEAPHAGVNVREVPVRTDQLVGQVARGTA